MAASVWNPVIGPRIFDFFSHFPGAADQPHTTIEGGGHFLQETRAEQFSQIIIDFNGRPAA
jgi:haloalkane dehalogenase